jgi:hypothetical protein
VPGALIELTISLVENEEDVHTAEMILALEFPRVIGSAWTSWRKKRGKAPSRVKSSSRSTPTSESGAFYRSSSRRPAFQ